MRLLREWIHRLSGTLRAGRRDGDLEEELRLHVEMAAEDARRHDDGGRAAQIHLGGTSQAMDALRDQRGLPWLDDLARDLRHGVRSLRRTPVFTAVALVTLALGIGANTAIFSIVNGVILQPMPYPRPEQLMFLGTQFPGLPDFTVSPPEYLEFREIATSFSVVGGCRCWSDNEVNLASSDRPLRVRSAEVDTNLLRALGVEAAQGRLFTVADTEVSGDGDRPAVVLLSHGLWQAAFGGRPMVGQAVDVDGRKMDVVGIMPPGMDVMDNAPEIWLPLGLNPANRQNRGAHFVHVIGRLKEGVTAQAAQTEIDTLMASWGERTGASPNHTFTPMTAEGGHTLTLQPLQTKIVGDAGRTIWLLQAAVALVLLMVCANLANLVMARAESRRGEFAMRAALGASRGRLLRQAMTEGVLLSGAGGLLGLWVAAFGVRVLTGLYPDSVPRTSEVAIDAPVLLFAFGVSVATGVLFALVPAAQQRVEGLVMSLKTGGTGTGSTGRHHIRRALVTVEVAMAVMLLIGAGLLVRTLYNLNHVDAGFERSRRVTFSLSLPEVNYQPAARAQAYDRLLGALRSVTGVESATGTSDLPPSTGAVHWTTTIDNAGAERAVDVHFYQFVMRDYFDTLGIPIVQGRDFAKVDAASTGLVAVVNATLAKRFWPDQNAVGQRLRLGGDGNPWFSVIGVARDVKQGGLDQEIGPQVYLFVEQQLAPGQPDGLDMTPETLHVVMRTALPPDALSRTLDQVVRNVDRTVPIVRLREIDAVVAESIGRPRLLAQLLGMFAGLALLLAAVGTYGVLSYMVVERRREIGIRIALGAARSRVLALVMSQGLILTVIGLAVGLAGALALNRAIASLLFGVEPADPMTMVGVAVTMSAVAAFACWLPAWRAARLDPNLVLRAD